MLITKKMYSNVIFAVLAGMLVFSSCENNKWQEEWIYRNLPTKLWNSECETMVVEEYLRISDMLEDYAEDAVDEYEEGVKYFAFLGGTSASFISDIFGIDKQIEKYENHLEEIDDNLLDNMRAVLPLHDNPFRPETKYSDEALCEILLGTPEAIANPPEDVQQNIAWSIVMNLLADRGRPSITSCSYDRKNKVWNVRLDNAPNQTVSFFKRDDDDYDIEWTGTEGYIPPRQETNNSGAQGNAMSASGDIMEYYVDETDAWIPNADSSRYLAIASTDKSDVDGTNEFIDWNGDRTLVQSDKPGGKIDPVLSASQLIRGAYITPMPSTFDPNTVYFCYHADGQEFPNSGKVDLATKKYVLFEGTVIGMISRGTYEDCFLLLAEDGVKVLKQTKVGQKDKPVKSFSNIQEQFPGHANHDLAFKNNFAKEVINWLESQ